MKKTSFFIAALLAVFCNLTASASTIAYVPSTTSVAAGDSFTVDIYGTSVNQIEYFSLYLTASSTGNEVNLTGSSLGSNFSYILGAPTFPKRLPPQCNRRILAWRKRMEPSMQIPSTC